MLVAGFLGGMVGNLALVFAYFVGVARGGRAGAAVVHLTWSQAATADPPAAVIIVASTSARSSPWSSSGTSSWSGPRSRRAWLIVVGTVALAATVPNRGAATLACRSLPHDTRSRSTVGPGCGLSAACSARRSALIRRQEK